MAVVEPDAVAGEADDALDEMHFGIDGVVEDDDLAALDAGGGEHAAGIDGAEALLIDEQEITDEQGGLHRLRWDAEWLCGEGDDEDGYDDDVDEGLDRGKESGVMRGGFAPWDWRRGGWRLLLNALWRGVSTSRGYRTWVLQACGDGDAEEFTWSPPSL